MISLLRGKIARKSLEELVLDVNGVGYGVIVPLSTYNNLPAVGEIAEINIYTYVKENVLELFGFSSFDEKRMFVMLIGVSGIGPRASINILSNVSPSELVSGIKSGELGRRKIPGIGPKLASRIINELKDKVKLFDSYDEPGRDQRDNQIKDILSVLTNLGYKNNEIDDRMSKIREILSNNQDIENALKETLKIMRQ